MTNQRPRCRTCGREKGPGRCRPCRVSYLREWARRNRARRAERARRRYHDSARIRELSRGRNYRWREQNRERYLGLKREQSRRYRERGGGRR